MPVPLASEGEPAPLARVLGIGKHFKDHVDQPRDGRAQPIVKLLKVRSDDPVGFAHDARNCTKCQTIGKSPARESARARSREDPACDALR